MGSLRNVKKSHPYIKVYFLIRFVFSRCRRLDYFVVSERLVPKLSDSLIRMRVKGSDHCPVVLLLAI